MNDPHESSLRAHEPSLRELLEQRIAHVEAAAAQSREEAKTALVLAREIADHNREKDNMVRDELREQAATFVSGELFTSKHDTVNRRIDSVADRATALEKSTISRETYDSHAAGNETRLGAIEKVQANLQGRITMVGVGLGVLFTVLQIVLRLVGK